MRHEETVSIKNLAFHFISYVIFHIYMKKVKIRKYKTALAKEALRNTISQTN